VVAVSRLLLRMFKWLSRRGRTDDEQAPVSRDPVADAGFYAATLGRLPADLVEGGPAPEPAPEYIEDATEPSADAWEHEREVRRKQEEEES
jgi:hypothetical protein